MYCLGMTITVKLILGEWRVRLVSGGEVQTYYTGDKSDAFDTALDMLIRTFINNVR